MIQSIRSVLQATASLAMCASLCACAGPSLKPDVDYNKAYDFSEVRTVALHHFTTPEDEEGVTVLSDAVHERISLALLRALEAKGIQVVVDEEQADLLLSWYLVTEDKTEERTVTTGAMADLLSSPAFVSYYNRAAFYQCWECITPTSRTETEEYRLGTFFVDLIDPREQKSMWRSVTSTRLRGQFGDNQQAYDDAAATVLRAFPPAANVD